MILNNAPVNEAVLSNVGEIGEFRIRNSAKAFSILSSGLYANKIRAIVRELSCNAVDSHAAAGKKDTPFDVHLPNTLEPWFSIRDYGTGLTHAQVSQIYTTYFESTKTNSNEFIGALGLGSKSPFSYTDNFTVTAIRDGVKGIYSAFINGDGVPSIALMMTEDTDEPAGVEVKFSVNDRYDFDKFRQEARQVYTYFKLRPVVTGSSDFKFQDVEYETKDIVPGVHSYKDSRRSVAIMGNIAYPIDVPAADNNLGDFRNLLNCGLELHFGIGELDFQASREGLSYIPQTIDAIKRKLETLNAQLAIHVAEEADKIDNLWERAVFLAKKKDSGLWSAAVIKYATDTKLSTWDSTVWTKLKKFTFEVDALSKQYNIVIRGMQRSRGSKSCSSLKPANDVADQKDANGRYVYITNWHLTVDTDAHFVINDTKIGALERAKYHYRVQEQKDVYNRNVFVLEPADKTKPMKTKAFFATMMEPPKANIIMASSLLKKERKDSGLGKNVTILALQERGSGGYYREKEMVWRDAGKSDSFDSKATFYYLPLSGFEIQSKVGMSNVKEFYNDLKECGLKGLQTTIYGVRKGDIEFIRTQKNWVNIEDHISSILNKPFDNKLVMSLVLQAVDNFNLLQYNSTIVSDVSNPNSPYTKLVTQFKGYDKVKYSEQSLKRLCNRYATGVTFNPEAQVQKFVNECATISKRYPLLSYLRSAPNADVADYVNLIDTQKGI
jgi:hypothetical protein